MTYKTTISKEEIAALEQEATFKGEIKLIDTKPKAAAALRYLNKQPIVGIDTETKPSFKKGVQNEVALVQIATLQRAYLFRVNLIGFTPALTRFLENGQIIKVGLSLQDDYRAIRRKADITPQGFVELQHLCPAFGIREMGLKSIYAIIFGKRMNKSARLTNWEMKTLPNKALAYAALDAVSCLEIYNELKKQPLPSIHRFGLLTY